MFSVLLETISMIFNVNAFWLMCLYLIINIYLTTFYFLLMSSKLDIIWRLGIHGGKAKLFQEVVIITYS